MAARTFQEFLSMPLGPRVRLLLVALVIPLGLSFLLPLWRIEMFAPQYPKGLSLDIFSHSLAPGNDGRDLDEINILNHYIGMQNITRETLRDLDWMPFALGGLALIALRTAAIGTIRSLFDLAVITAYITLAAFGRFVYLLYTFGHELDPKAPITVEPFTPVIVGAKKIANFTTYSYPMLGSVLVGVFSVGLWAALAACLIHGRREARGATAAAADGRPAAVAAAGDA